MQPIKAAIYVRSLDTKRIEAEVAKLNEYLINDGCVLANSDQVFADSDDSLSQLTKLVEQAQDHEALVIYVSQDIVPEDRELYKALINKLYVQGISILLCNS